MGDDTEALIAIDQLVGSTDVDVLGVEVLDDVCVGSADDSDVVAVVPEQADAATRTQTRADGLIRLEVLSLHRLPCTHAKCPLRRQSASKIGSAQPRIFR